MKFLLYLQAAVGSLLQHKLRSFLSVLGIICGVAAVFAILAIGEGARREVLSSISRLGLNNIILRSLDPGEQNNFSGKTYGGLKQSDRGHLLATVPMVENAAMARELTGLVVLADEQLRLPLLACTPGYRDLLSFNLSAGRFISDSDDKDEALVCVLGGGVYKKIGVEGRLGGMLRIGKLLFRVVGILEESGVEKNVKSPVGTRDIDGTIFIPFSSHRYLVASQNRGAEPDVSELLIRIREADQVEDSVDLIRRVLEVSREGEPTVQVIVPRELLRQSRKTQRIFSLVLGSIGTISLLVGGIGIMNVMLATVSERTREVGLRRAVGATKKQITAQFLAESILLTSVGGVLGLVAGLAAAVIISTFAGWPTGVSLTALLLPLLMSVAVGGFFGLYPAVKAAAMDPVHALRYV
ncbi:MAG: ABC transporter permease [Thermodesulfobacteriota bacterium]